MFLPTEKWAPQLLKIGNVFLFFFFFFAKLTKTLSAVLKFICWKLKTHLKTATAVHFHLYCTLTDSSTERSTYLISNCHIKYLKIYINFLRRFNYFPGFLGKNIGIVLIYLPPAIYPQLLSC